MADPLIDFATVPPIPLHPAVLAARQPVDRGDVGPARRPGRVARRPMAMACHRPRGCRAALRALPDPRASRGGDRRDRGRPRRPRRIDRPGGAAAGRHGSRPLGASRRAGAARRGGLGRRPGRRRMDDPPDLRAHRHGQRSYGWYNAWYLKEGLVGVETVRPSEDAFPPEPTDEEEAAGSPVGRPGAPRRRGRREHRGGGRASTRRRWASAPAGPGCP